MKIEQPSLFEYAEIITALMELGYDAIQIAMILQDYESGNSLSLAMIHEYKEKNATA